VQTTGELQFEDDAKNVCRRRSRLPDHLVDGDRGSTQEFDHHAAKVLVGRGVGHPDFMLREEFARRLAKACPQKRS
jgi:hypothetical protein